jgi:hypothetical protein
MLSSVAGFIIAITGVLAGILALMSDELKDNKRLKYILVAVLLALSVYAMFGSLLSISGVDSQVEKSNIPIAIDATKDWQSTGISVQKGDTIVVSVVGGGWTASRRNLSSSEVSEEYSGWQVWANMNFENLGEGGTYNCIDYGVPNCPVPTSNIATLVGKIDLIGEPFLIGSSNTVTAPRKGNLYLRINDGEKEGLAGLSDNDGVLAVLIDGIDNQSHLRPAYHSSIALLCAKMQYSTKS